jgi:alpha-L-fucosidase
MVPVKKHRRVGDHARASAFSVVMVLAAGLAGSPAGAQGEVTNTVAAVSAPVVTNKSADDSGARLSSRSEAVAAAVARLPAIPPGPFEPTWASIRAHYQDPEWFRDAKFGIMMHWGIYSVPAHGSEWYVRYMYGGNAGIMAWHTKHYGPPTVFGYKDFLPLFTAAKWDPDAWAELFKEAGARYVIASGEHHDGFSNWASDINRYNAKNYGPKRDLVGDLLAAVRKVGLKTGVANHSNAHFNFIPPLPGSDQYDPEWAAFYSVADRSDAAYAKFLETWVTKNMELVDKYQPDMLWFDMNGGDRSWDPLKVRVAAYYYNRAATWGKPVAISAKGESFLAGVVMDYERQGRAPKRLTDFVWQPDDPIADKFGYVEAPDATGKLAGLPLKSPGSLVHHLVVNVSRNGNLLLNISPKADGTIPEAQQQVLRAIGRWLGVNGEAIYGTRPWKMSEEGSVHFTTKGQTLYAISLTWPTNELMIPALGRDKGLEGKVDAVELLGHAGTLQFTQGAEGLKVSFPAEKPCDYCYALKISGLKLAAAAASIPAHPNADAPGGPGLIPQQDISHGPIR